MATTSLSVQLDLAIARALHAEIRTPAADAVRRAADEVGVTLRPLHPGQTHDLLMPFFVVEAPDRTSAERIATRLREVPGVEGAWLQPPQAIP
jgi:hypothetical protein